ncbi:MAG: cytochrome c5 family protein [Tatlockia sp.]|nr:cytochrome c5 family protein [Tatlockia sp.]
MRFALFISLLALSISLWASSSSTREEIVKRIKPIGQVNVVKQELPVQENNPSKETPGRAIYEQYCSVCHQDGIAAAPRFRNAENWRSRLDKESIDELVASATKGLNAMPMKGTCMECSDEDIRNAIQYMLPKS